MKTSPYYNQVVTILKTLHSEYPKYTMGQHISTALDGYTDVWGMTDKAMLYAFEKYAAELQYDIPHRDTEIDDIIKQGIDINKLREELYEEEED